MIRSFRLRLALLSALLSGLVLAAFGLGSLWLIRNIQTDKIDSELRAHAERQVGRQRDADDWLRAEGDLAMALGVRRRDDLLLLVQTDAGQTLYQSPQWPTELATTRLVWPIAGGARREERSGLDWLPSAHAAAWPEPAPLQLAQAPGGGPDGVPGAGPRGVPGGGIGRGGGGPDGPGGARGAPPHRPAPRPPEAQANAQTDLRPRPAQEDLSQTAPLQNVPSQPLPDARRPPTDEAPLRPQPPPARPPPPASSTQNMLAGQQHWRLGLAATDTVRVAVAVNSAVMDGTLRGTRNAFLLALPFALVLIGAGSWFFAGRALQPVRKLTEATRRVTAEDLGQRLSTQGEDAEFAGLIAVFNRMLERLERSFEQAHRFSADAAHELKTPLAILQGQLERAIGQAGDGSPMQASLTSILDEVQRLSTISRKLLLLSQADAGKLGILRAPFDLSGALTDLLEDTRMLAPHLRVEGDIQNGLTIQGDASLLRQVLHNLISNAIKYNQGAGAQQGWIRISTARWANRVEVLVANASGGIPVALREKVFVRFFRVDSAHSRTIEGVGLGLSVSREIARAHGGDLTLKGDMAGQVQFSLLLPVA